MLATFFIALLQAAAGDPAPAAVAETPAVETAAPAPATAPRTERRRVCDEDAAATGGRLARRRCHWEEAPVQEEAAPVEAAAAPVEQHPSGQQTGGSANAATPAPQ